MGQSITISNNTSIGQSIKGKADRFDANAVVAMSIYKNDKVNWVIESVESVLSQSYTNFVLVIYLDGPVSDEIEKSLSLFQESTEQIVVMRSQHCDGLAYAMNQISMACREWEPEFFARMDADDISEPDRLQKQIDFFTKTPETDVLGTSIIEIDEVGRRVGYRNVPQHHHVLKKALSRRCPFNHPSVFMRYDKLMSVGSYDVRLKNTQDYFLWIEMARNGAIFANLREPLLKFRRVDGFYKRRGKEKSLNELKARFTAMRELNQWSLFNICYAIGVFTLRMMPSPVIKLAYKLDRSYFHKRATDK